MPATKTIATVRLDGGHPALDFVNTVDAWRDGWGPDFLRSYEDLVTWAARTGLIDEVLAAPLRQGAASDPDESRRALERAKSLRDALHELFLAEADGQPAGEQPVAMLNALLSQAGVYRELQLDGDSFQWAWRRSADLDTILYRLAYVAADLLATRAERRDVRECHGINCGWLFLDTSRSGRRQWCAEETCGTRMRVHRFRHRQG